MGNWWKKRIKRLYHLAQPLSKVVSFGIVLFLLKVVSFGTTFIKGCFFSVFIRE